MTSHHPPLPTLVAAGLMVVLAGCADPQSLQSPVEPVVQAAKGGGGGGPTVTAASPAAAPPAVTLDVQVLGSGFDSRSNARWLRTDGLPSQVLVNSTAFISKSELVANITVDAGAVDAVYDIEVVTGRGKKGLGAELFSVDQNASTAPSVTVLITTSVQGAGIYGDGDGSVPYPATFNESGDLWVIADCPREIRLDLRAEGLGAPFNDVVATCDPGNGGASASPRVTIQDLLSQTGPTTLPTIWDEGSTNFGQAQNYYILEDGKRYNVVWRGGIHVTSVSGCVDDTKTYTISTDPDLAGDDPDEVGLWTRAAKGKPRMVAVDGSVTAHLELSVQVTPCP